MSLSDMVLSVSDEAMIEFSGKVDRLNADVLVSLNKLPKATNLDHVQGQFVLWAFEEWEPWYALWLAWAVEHQSGFSRLPASSGIEFGKFKSDFNIHLSTYTAFGGTTSLKPSDTTVPIDPPEEDEEPWYETVTDTITTNIMLTSLVAGAGLLAYWHVTKR